MQSDDAQAGGSAGSRPYVQVRLPAKGLVLATAVHRPGAHIDALVESDVGANDQPIFRVWGLVDGVTREDMETLQTKLEARYDVRTRVEQAGSGFRLLYEVEPQKLSDPFWGTLLAFQASFGPPWLHFSAGEVTMRAQSVDGSPEECATRLRNTLQLAEEPHDVEVVVVPPPAIKKIAALEAWRESVLGHGRS